MGGVRIVFRMFQLILTAGMFIFYFAPLRVCRHELQRRSFFAMLKECIPDELRATYCAHFKFQSADADVDTPDGECQVLGALIWSTIIITVLLLAYTLDTILGRRFIVKRTTWSVRRRFGFYWMFLGGTAAGWFSIMVAMSVALGVTWPETISSQGYVPKSEHETYLRGKNPPARWTATLIVSAIMLCVDMIEGSTLYMFPESYFDPKVIQFDEDGFVLLSMHSTAEQKYRRDLL